jgi:UDP-glucose 4-epimerase
MRVLVTGAFGFVGGAVGRRLAADAHEVVALTSRPLGSARPPGFAAQVRRADVRDPGAVAAAVRGMDAVCHLAGLGRVRESFERPAEYLAVNASGTTAVLAAAQAAGASRFVLASSVAVYGAPERQPIREDAPLTPASPYGESKAAAEHAVTEAASQGGLGAACLRIFNAAGADGGVTDPDASRIIPRTLAVSAGKSPFLEVNGDGSAVRDYVHVTDVAEAFVLALSACQPGACAVYNVGATPASVADILAVAADVTGRPVDVRRNPSAREPAVLVADCTQIRADLGWIPSRSSLRQIIADSWQAYR